MYKQVDLKRDPKHKVIPDPPLDWDEQYDTEDDTPEPESTKPGYR